MESFVRTDAHLAVIATVSPIPTDTEHSISTLRTVCAIAGYNDSDMIEEKQEVKCSLSLSYTQILLCICVCVYVCVYCDYFYYFLPSSLLFCAFLFIFCSVCVCSIIYILTIFFSQKLKNQGEAQFA
jgi:hypothetical protein